MRIQLQDNTATLGAGLVCTGMIHLQLNEMFPAS